MPGNNSDLPKLPLRLSVLQIIGLKDPDEGNWSRLRALQYAQLHKVQLTRGIAVFERAKADVAGAGKGLHDRGKSVPGFDLRAARVRRIYPEIRAACEAQL